MKRTHPKHCDNVSHCFLVGLILYVYALFKSCMYLYYKEVLGAFLTTTGTTCISSPNKIAIILNINIFILLLFYTKWCAINKCDLRSGFITPPIIIYTTRDNNSISSNSYNIKFKFSIFYPPKRLMLLHLFPTFF